MKKISVFLAGLSLILILFVFAACTPREFSVTFVTPQGVAGISAQTVKEGACLTEPNAPQRDGWTFGGWFTSNAYEEHERYDFNTPVTFGFHLYAKMVPADISGVLQWTLAEDGQSYIVSGFETGWFDEIVIPSSYNGKPVSVIGERAFKESGITSVTIPSTITRIENSAFSECYSLTSVVLEEGLFYIGAETFKECAFEGITLPQSLTEIGARAFSNCANIESVTIPNAVTYLGAEAFSHCEKLTEVFLSNSLTSINSGVFYYCSSLQKVNLPDSITSIGENAFSYCGSLTSLILKESITHIGNAAFLNCGNLTLFSLAESKPDEFASGWNNNRPVYWSSCWPSGSGNYHLYGETYAVRGFNGEGEEIAVPSYYNGKKVTSIEPNAFKGKDITKITLSLNITSIGESAFEDCSFLTEVVFQDKQAEGDIDIGKNAFKNCTLLNGIDFDALNTDFYIRDYAFERCESLIKIVIGGNVKSLGKGVFKNCTALEEADLTQCDALRSEFSDEFFSGCASLATLKYDSSNVKTIGNYTFYNCTQLEITVDFASVGDYAFYNCVKVREVNISNLNFGPNKLGESAFEGCTGIEEVTLYLDCAEIGKKAFYGCGGITDIYLSISASQTMFKIGDYAFYGCEKIQSFSPTVSSHTINIGSHAFNGCSLLNFYLNGTGVIETVGDYAFAGTKISHIDLEGTKSVGSHAFYQCEELPALHIFESLATIGASAFEGCIYLNNITVLKANENLTIGAGAFKNCSALETLVIEGVKEIGASAFENCGLEKSSYVIIDEKTLTVGENAFKDCNPLIYVAAEEKDLPDGWASGWNGGCTVYYGLDINWEIKNGSPQLIEN